MQKVINTFENGMNQDLPLNRFDSKSYYLSENLELVHTDETGEIFSLKSINGNTLSGSLPSNLRMHGGKASIQIKDYLYIICIRSNYNSEGAIYRFTINEDGSLTGGTSIYSLKDMGFSFDYPVIKITGYYESDDFIKLYWIDGYNYLRSCEVTDPDLDTYDVERFNIYPSYSQYTIPTEDFKLISGNLKNGIVQYSYQLYSLKGAATDYSDPSTVYSLFNSNPSDNNFSGGKEGETSGKGVLIKLQSTGNYDLDTNFTKVKILRIFYSNLLSEPEINVISDKTITYNQDIYVEDTGENLESISYQDFVFSSYKFIPKTIETKNNIMFLGNIEEEVWDASFDARAYRFGVGEYGTRYSRIYNVNYTEVIEISTSGSWVRYNISSGSAVQTGSGTNWSIPEDFDCVNIFNDLAKTSLDADELSSYHTVKSSPYYAYQYPYNLSATGVLGASGRYVQVRFTTKSNTKGVSPIMTNDPFKNSITISTSMSFHRDEIYAIALVMINTKGQKSEPKWICDLRTPSVYEGYAISNNSNIVSLHLRVTVTNSALPSDCEYIQLVRCERTLRDRTILCQGLVGGTHYESGSYYGSIALTPIGAMAYRMGSGELTSPLSGTYLGYGQVSRSLLEFISPEVCFNKNIEPQPGHYLKPVYSASGSTRANNSTTYAGSAFYKNVLLSVDYNYSSTWNFVYRLTSLNYDSWDTGVSNLVKKLTITDGKYLNEGNSSNGSLSIGGKTYYHYSKGEGVSVLKGNHGTCLILYCSEGENFYTNTSVPWDTYGTHFYKYNYKQNIVPYGGFSYDSRKNRKYIPAGPIVEKGSGSSTTVNGTYGDTFITYFDYARTMTDTNPDTTEMYTETVGFYVESSINCGLRVNSPINQKVLLGNTFITANRLELLAHEDPGTYSRFAADVHTQDYYMYEYNSVYSRANNTVKYYPINSEETSYKFPIRIHYSDKKYAKELIDSWSVWRPLNLKDIDNKYGEIKSLNLLNNNLICFQEKGIALLSVEERQVINSGTTQQTSLGTGGVLERYDYISTTSGTIYPNLIINGKKGLYYYDDLNNSFNRIENNYSEHNLTKLQGIQTYLNKLFGRNNTIYTILSAIDKKLNNIYFTISTDNPNIYRTIVFNEALDKFTFHKNSDYYYTGTYPRYYIQGDKYLYSIPNSSQISIYLENDINANYATLYGTAQNLKLILVVSPQTGFTSRFDIIEWINRVSSGTEFTFDKIRLYNSYQNTGTLNLTSSNLYKIFRKYRFNKLLIASGSEYARLKDEYLVIELTCSGTTHQGRQLVIGNVTTTFSSTAPH